KKTTGGALPGARALAGRRGWASTGGGSPTRLTDAEHPRADQDLSLVEPVHRGGVAAAVGPGARRVLPLPPLAAHPLPVGARQVPAAGGRPRLPDGALARARDGHRVLGP